MTIEHSHGKARPTLPRAADLHVVGTVPDPSAGRSEHGRFSAGNRISVGAGWKASIKKLMGRGALDGDAHHVAREAMRLYLAAMRDLPSDGATVRMLVALQARHAALAAFFTDRAGTMGLTSPDALAALEQAGKHGQRAERLAVTAVDVATKLGKRDRDTSAPPWLSTTLPDDGGGVPK